MIKCFSHVVGHKEAQDLVNDLNAMKSKESDGFYIKYFNDIDYDINPTYTVVGYVTKEDWDELNLEFDFMQADII